MATETIEGPARPIRAIVCNGRSVMTGLDMIPIGEPDVNGVCHRIANPNKYMFGPGEEVDLSPDDFARMHASGHVRRPDEDQASLHVGNLSFPASSQVPIGNVKPHAGLG